MKKRTKLLVILLSVALLCTGLAVAVSAASADELDMSKAEGGKLVLDSDVKISSTIEITENLTIDLAGHTLTSTADVAFNVIGNVDFAIVGNGAVTVDGGIVHTESANIKIAGVKGIDITQTNAKGDVPIVYTGAGTHLFTNINVDSMADSADLFSVGGVSNNTFAAMIVSSESGEAKDNSGRAAKSVISMRNNGPKVKLSHSTIDVKGINAISVAENIIRYEGFVDIENCYIATANAANASGSAPAFIAGDVSIASDIIVKDSSIFYNNRIQINGNTEGSAIIFKNTDIFNRGGGEPFFQNANVMLLDGSSVAGTPASTNASYANKTPFFASNDNKGSMTVGNHKNVNLYIEKGTRFDEATMSKLMAPGTFYTLGQVAYDNGALPTDPISGEEGAVSYLFEYDFPGYSTIPYILVSSDESAEVVSGVSLHNDADTASKVISGWGTVSKENLDPIGPVEENGNTFYRYLKNDPLSAQNIFYNFSNKPTDAPLFVYDMDISCLDMKGFATFNVSLNARSTADGRNGVFFSVSNDGTVSPNGAYMSGGSSTKIVPMKWNHISVVLDTTPENGLAYVYVNGVYVGSSSPYQSNIDYILGMRFDVRNTSVLGSSFTLDNASLRRFDEPLDTNLTPDEIRSKYLYGGGVAWNDSSDLNSITAGGRNVADIESAIALYNEFGVVSTLNMDCAYENAITESFKINTNGYTFSAASGSITSNLDENGICEFDEKYNLSLDVRFYTGAYRIDSAIADDANYTEVVKYKVGEAYNSVYPGELTEIESYKTLYNNYYKAGKLIGWSQNPYATEPDAPMNYDYAVEHKGETLKLYPVYNADDAAPLYAAIVVKADGTVDEARCINVGNDYVIWNGQYGTLNVQYGETIILQKNLRTQGRFDRAWSNASKNGANAENKTINIDLNGYELKVDQNASQSGECGKVTHSIPALEDQTINVYSSHEGGKIANYGGTSSYVSGGRMFNMSGANSTLNVGTFTKADGTVVPGSNLTLEGSAILDMRDTDGTGTANIDGVTVSINAIDTEYASSFMTKGTASIKNCIIAAPLKNGIKLISTHGDAASGSLEVDNCTLITSENGEAILGKIEGMQSVIFTNCVTNGSFTLPADANSAVSVKLGAGNIYSESSVSLLADNAFETDWGNPTVFTNGATSFTAKYFTVKENNDWSSNKDDYAYHTYEIRIGGESGENVLALPGTLAYKTISGSDIVSITYNLADGSVLTDQYIKGQTVKVPEISDIEYNAIKFVFSGKFDVEIPEVIESDLTVTPIYNKTENITGVKTNISIYADYGINLYIPYSYAQYITSITENGSECITSVANLSNSEYIMVTVYRESYDVTKDAVFTINIEEGGFTAVKEISVSVASYAKKVIESADPDITDAEKMLMKYMLTYSKEAIKYFGKPEDAMLNELLTGVVLDEYDYASKAVDTTALAAVFSAVSVDISSADLAYVFVVKEGFDGTFAITIGSNTYTEADIKNGMVRVGGMKVYNFASDITINAENAGGEAIVTDAKYNLATFVNSHADGVAGSASEACLPLIKAFYNYALKADECNAN